MMTLPPELDQCLHKHTPYILKVMVPDGVYVFLSGAKLLDQEDRQKFTWAHDSYGKNHALLNIISKHGKTGFDSFLEALETTQQTDIVERITSTLREKNTNVGEISNLAEIKKTDSVLDSSSSKATHDSVVPSTSVVSLGDYIVGPRVTSSSSFSFTRTHSVARTPLTPPLSETELDEHLHRLKSLLHRITSSHNDRFCRQEAKDLLGELDQAGSAMMDRVRQLSEENTEKENELRRAKFMVRGMEAEICRLRNSTTTTPCDLEKNGKTAKSKLCLIL